MFLISFVCPDWGASNDPEALGLAFHQGPTFIHAFCQATTNWVDRDWGNIWGYWYLGQGGLRSPSTSSSFLVKSCILRGLFVKRVCFFIIFHHLCFIITFPKPHKCTYVVRLIFTDDSEPSPWRTLKGEYHNVSVFSMPGLSQHSPLGMSKLTHLADGAVDLVVTRKIDRQEFIRFLRRHGKPMHKNQVWRFLTLFAQVIGYNSGVLY